jgi:large subunit ribosomal protein L29
MAIINKQEFKNMDKGDLIAKFKELKIELIKENAQIAIGTTPKSPGKVRQIKKSIARMLQLLNEKYKEDIKDK